MTQYNVAVSRYKCSLSFLKQFYFYPDLIQRSGITIDAKVHHNGLD